MNAKTQFQNAFGQSHAFLIGINNYQYVNRLNNAINDVEAIAEVLKEEVHSFVVHPPLLDATYEQLTHLLEVEMPKLLKEGDRVMFYFAGHGVANDSIEDGVPEGYILPSDAKLQAGGNWLAMSDLNKALQALACKHFFLVLDCCFSGAFRWASNKRDTIQIPKKIYRQRFDRYVSDPAWQVLTSSSYDQKASDGLSEIGAARNKLNQENSPFAQHFINALLGNADVVPDEYPDGLITAHEIYLYIRDKIERQSMDKNERDRQTPGLFTLPKHDKGEFLFLSPKVELNLPTYDEAENPYKGLEPYKKEDTVRFFGHDQASKELVEKIRSEQLIIVVGESGRGKSSLIQAGISPLWEDHNMFFMYPSEQPSEELDTLLPKFKTSEQPPILLIDQSEQLLTQYDEEEQTKFVKKLESLHQDSKLKVVIAVRSDFELELKELLFEEHWEKARFNMPKLSPMELREIIERPAKQRIILFDPPELVDQIVEQVQNASNPLPLLSFVMSELYEKMKARGEFGAFKKADYEAMGGVLGALYKRANALYHELPVEEQNTMQKILLRMVSQEQNGAEIKMRPILKKELVYLEEEENTRIAKVLDKLIEARLVVASTNSVLETTIVPIHEALILSWDTLLGWINVRGKDKLSLLHQLYEANTEYQRTTSARDLWHGNQRLDRIKIETQWLNASEQSFVQASVQRKNRNRIVLAATTVFTIAALVVLALVAVKQRNEALKLSKESLILNETLLFEDGAAPMVDFQDINIGFINIFNAQKYKDRLIKALLEYVSMSDSYRYLLSTGQSLFEEGEYREALTYFANARFVRNVYDTDDIEKVIKSTENLKFSLHDDSETKNFDGLDFLKSKRENSNELDSIIETCRAGIEANRLYFSGDLITAKEKYKGFQMALKGDSVSTVFPENQIVYINSIMNELESAFNEKDSSLSFRIEKLDILPKETYKAKILNLSDNKLEEAPQNIHLFKNLEKILLNRNNLTSVPESFSELEQLRILELKGNLGLMGNLDLLIKHLPTSINELDLSRNGVVKQLPNSLQKLNNLKLLKLSVKKESQESLGQRRMDFFQIIEQVAADSAEVGEESLGKETSVFGEVNASDDLIDLTALDNFEQDLEIIIADENDFEAKGFSMQSSESSLSVEKKNDRIIVILFKEITSETLPESLRDLKNLKSIDVSRSIHKEEYKKWLSKWLPDCELIYE